ncbi:MAG: ATP-binding protein, partial [Collinsella sp.]
MSDDFYTMVDSGDPAPDNEHITGVREERVASDDAAKKAPSAMYAARIAVYDDMLSTPRVIVIEPQDVRTYLEETTNTVYQCMKEQGGHISLMVIREIVENFIHAHFAEPIISILDGGDTIRFADQGPGIDDKERAFDFGVTSANSSMKRYIRGTGAGFPMVQE